MKQLLLSVAAILAVAVAAVSSAPSPADSQAHPEFILGFKTLHDLIPNIVGQPLEDQHFDPSTGDALQKTTNGLLVWRKADNSTAFTNGTTTWVNGPYGVQVRSNYARFKWESQPGGPTASNPGKLTSISSTTLGGYGQYQYTDPVGQSIDLLLYVPPAIQAGQKLPLVLVLEGSGEEAMPGMTPSEGLALLVGHPYVDCWVPDPANPGAPNVQSRWPSFIVIPELNYPARFVDVPGAQGSYQLAPNPTIGLLLAKEIVDALQLIYTSVDPSRLYVTGISMGGYGTWDAIERWPDYFAAAAPASGAGDPANAYELKDLPIWVFDGTGDEPSLVAASRDMVQAIQAAGGQPKYTQVPSSGHDIWASVYDVTEPDPSANLFRWVFSQRQANPE